MKLPYNYRLNQAHSINKNETPRSQQVLPRLAPEGGLPTWEEHFIEKTIKNMISWHGSIF